MTTSCIFDIETNGLLNEMDKIHCLVIIDCQTEEVFSYKYNQIAEGIARLTSYHTLIGHNILGFDIPAIQKIYPNFKSQSIIDTLICSRLIWPNLKEIDLSVRDQYHASQAVSGKYIGKHSLAAWGERLNVQKGDFHQDTDWKEWSQDMQTYCEQDVRLNLKLWKCIRKKYPSLQSVELEHRFASIIRKQEEFGFCFDMQKAEELKDKLKDRQKELEIEFQTIFPPLLKTEVFIPKVNNRKYGYVKGQPFEKKKVITFEPGSRDHIATRLQYHYKWKPLDFTMEGKPKVDEKILDSLDYPVCKLLIEYLTIQKRLGQLAEGRHAWITHAKQNDLNPNEFRIHGRVITNGAVTGRCTHYAPNIAQVPAISASFGKECRSLFTVPEGWLLVGCDASGLELRCLAHYLYPYDKGAYIKEIISGDIHVLNQKAAGISSRDLAKRFIYAFLYGAGDWKIGSIIDEKASTKQKKNIGKKLKEQFFQALPAFAELCTSIKKNVEEESQLIGLDMRGLPIRHPHAALNTLLQSAGAIIMKQATVNFIKACARDGLKFGRDYALSAHIHDEMQIACRKDIAKQIAELAKNAIREAGQPFQFKCPLEAEASIGKDWSETH